MRQFSETVVTLIKGIGSRLDAANIPKLHAFPGRRSRSPMSSPPVRRQSSPPRRTFVSPSRQDKVLPKHAVSPSLLVMSETGYQPKSVMRNIILVALTTLETFQASINRAQLTVNLSSYAPSRTKTKSSCLSLTFSRPFSLKPSALLTASTKMHLNLQIGKTFSRATHISPKVSSMHPKIFMRRQ